MCPIPLPANQATLFSPKSKVSSLYVTKLKRVLSQMFCATRAAQKDTLKAVSSHFPRVASSDNSSRMCLCVRIKEHSKTATPISLWYFQPQISQTNHLQAGKVQFSSKKKTEQLEKNMHNAHLKLLRIITSFKRFQKSWEIPKGVGSSTTIRIPKPRWYTVSVPSCPYSSPSSRLSTRTTQAHSVDGNGGHDASAETFQLIFSSKMSSKCTHPSVYITVRTWKWMLGILFHFLLGVNGLFSGVNSLLVSGRVSNL